MCSTLYVSTTKYPIYRLSALLYVAIIQTTICCALLCLAILCTTDYPLYYACRYNYRPSAFPTIGSALSGDILQPASPSLCSTLSSETIYNRPSALLSLSIVLPSALYGDILQPTICYALLCLTIRFTTNSPPYYAYGYNYQLSALPTIRSALSGDKQQPTIYCALLRLASLQLTIRSDLPVDITTDYPL
jgi:hypothetical protein